MTNSIFLGILLNASAAMPVVDNDTICRKFVNTTVRSTTMDAAISSFSVTTPKGEYETTAGYKARRDAALPAEKTVVVRVPVKDTSSFTYDADKNALAVSGYAFLGSGGFNPYHLLGSAAADLSNGQNLNVAVSSHDTGKGSYRATNAFGAVGNVARVSRISKVIFDGNRANIAPPLDIFKTGFRTNVVGYIPLEASEARRLKTLLRLSFVVVPQEPYVVTVEYSRGAPTLDDPRQINERTTVLLGDIQCGLVTDNFDKVLAAFPTN